VGLRTSKRALPSTTAVDAAVRTATEAAADAEADSIELIKESTAATTVTALLHERI
jgi:hypothetical protein